MSVSAHPTPQPGTEEYHPVFVAKTLEQLGEILTRYPTKQAALLPALWLVQGARGWSSDRNMAGGGGGFGGQAPYRQGAGKVFTLYYPHPGGEHLLPGSATWPRNGLRAQVVRQALLAPSAG